MSPAVPPGDRSLCRFLWASAVLLHLLCPQVFFTNRTQNPYLIQIVLLHAGVLLAVLAAGAFVLARGRWEGTATALDGPLALFVSAALVSWGLSALRHPSLRWSLWNEGLKGAVFLLVNAGVFGWSAHLSRNAGSSALRRLMLSVGAVAAGYALLQYAGRDPVWPQAVNPYNGRPVSTYGNPNFLSTAMVLFLPLGLGEYVSARTRAGAALAGAVSWLFVSALLCTMTRSSYVGALAALSVFALAAWPAVKARPARGVFWLVAVIALVVLWPGSRLSPDAPSPAARVVDLWRGVTGGGVYGSWHQRLLIWSSAGDMWRERPLWGKGWGLFELFFPFYQGRYLSDDIFRQFRTHANNAHQLLLEIGSQTGLVGVGLAVWLAALTWRGQREARFLSPESRTLSAAFLGGLAGAVADNMFGNVSLFFAVPGFLFFWIWGQWAGLVAGGKRTWTPTRITRGTLGVAVAVVCGLGLVREARVWAAALGQLEGAKKSQAGDLRGASAALERSWNWNGADVATLYELGNLHARQARWAREQGLTLESAAEEGKARAAYEGALKANAGYDEIHFNRANLSATEGRSAEAVLDWRLSLLINPLNRDAYRSLGSAYLSARPADARAVDLFERAAFFFPRERDFWRDLGSAREAAEDLPGAGEAVRRALRLDLTSAESWAALRRLSTGGAEALWEAPRLMESVRAEARRKNWAGARRAAESLARLAPENGLARLMAADMAAEAGDWPSAESGYRQFLAWEPDHWEARLNLSHVLQSSGRREEARRGLEALRRERPQDADIERRLKELGNKS